jgi:hypothetical protein
MVGIAPLPSSISNACLLVNANLDKASGEPTAHCDAGQSNDDNGGAPGISAPPVNSGE